MSRNIFPNEQFIAGYTKDSTLLRLVDGLKFEIFTDQACTVKADIVDAGLQPLDYATVSNSGFNRFYGTDAGETVLYARELGETGDGFPMYAYGIASGGSGGPSSYIHHQDTPAAVWTVVHNLGFPPGGINVVTSAGDVVKANINYPPDKITTTVVITFTGALAGRAYLS